MSDWANPYPSDDPVSRLAFELSKLPGIGEKTAMRLAYAIVKRGKDYTGQLVRTLQQTQATVRFCNQCFTLTDREVCRICQNSDRDHSLVCVVEKPSDIYPIENTLRFKGVFHVLHGALSPLDGIGPQDLRIAELLERLNRATPAIREFILALNPTIEGDATALYISKLTRPMGIKVSKLAHGIPIGGQLEFSDKQTLSVALDNRVEMH